MCVIALQVHSACRDIIDLKGANTRECTYRDLWHMILIPQAVTHRMAIKSHMEQEAESTGGREERGGGEGTHPCLARRSFRAPKNTCR